MTKEVYTVYIDDNFHYMDEDYRYKLKAYDSLSEAIVVCQALVDACLKDLLEESKTTNKKELSASELYNNYTAFGIDPWIQSASAGVAFSAWNYAKEQSKKLTKIKN